MRLDSIAPLLWLLSLCRLTTLHIRLHTLALRETSIERTFASFALVLPCSVRARPPPPLGCCSRRRWILILARPRPVRDQRLAPSLQLTSTPDHVRTAVQHSLHCSHLSRHATRVASHRISLPPSPLLAPSFYRLHHYLRCRPSFFAWSAFALPHSVAALSAVGRGAMLASLAPLASYSPFARPSSLSSRHPCASSVLLVPLPPPPLRAARLPASICLPCTSCRLASSLLCCYYHAHATRCARRVADDTRAQMRVGSRSGGHPSQGRLKWR